MFSVRSKSHARIIRYCWHCCRQARIKSLRWNLITRSFTGTRSIRVEKITKTSEQLRRDYDAYEQVMFAKAIRQGMTPEEAHAWTKEQSRLQSELRQQQLEEAEARRQGFKK